MADFRCGYSVQYWLECASQGYLLGTEFGHLPGQAEPDLLLSDDRLREQAIQVTAQLVFFERCTLASSAGLIRAAPDDASRCFLATQTLDEARHVEVFTRRLLDLGVTKPELDVTIQTHANPHLVRLAELLDEKVDQGNFLAGVVGQNVILEGMAGPVYELLHAASEGLNPKFARTLGGVRADESRHAFFGERRARELIREHPEQGPELERMQREMAGAMLGAFALALQNAPRSEERALLRGELMRRSGGLFALPPIWQGAEVDTLEPDELQRRLEGSVLQECKRRLERIGLAYQTPVRS